MKKRRWKTGRPTKATYTKRYRAIYRSNPTPADYRIAGYKTPKRKWRK